MQVPLQILVSFLTSIIIPPLAGFQLKQDKLVYFFLCHVFMSISCVNVVKGFIFMGAELFDG